MNRTDQSSVTTLYDELDKLRRNICHDCKTRLALPGNASGSAPAISSTSVPFWHRIFQTRQSRLPSTPALDIAGSGRTSNPEISGSTVSTLVLINSETIPDETTANTSTTSAGCEQTLISSEPESEPPKFSVEYNPDVKRALSLHLEHVFAHESLASCVKISPDGQRMAVGFGNGGATIINDMKTRSKVRSVSECLVRNLG